MAKGTLNYTFRGSSKRLERLKDLIDRAVEEAIPSFNPGGPVENWGQSGGWVLSVEDKWSQRGGWYLVVEPKKEAVRASRPDDSLTKITATVYKALSKAERRR